VCDSSQPRRPTRDVTRIAIEAIAAAEGEVTPQAPLAANEWSEPQSDVYVLAPHHGIDGLPSQATLVVEGAVSSRGFDLGVKAR
jgi:hypothetical protein